MLSRLSAATHRRTVLGVLLLGLVLSTGCATTGRTSTPNDDLQRLHVRVSELEAANQHLTRSIDALRQDVTLWRDRFQALQLAVQQRQRLAALPVERPVTRRHHGTRLDDEPVEDIVVSDDTVRRYIGQPQPRRRAGPRTAKANVVHGDRLPVQPVAGTRTKKAPKPSSNNPMELYQDGIDLYRQGDFKTAIARFESFLNTSPPNDYVDNALYWLGDCYYGLGDFSSAATYFHRIVKEHPDANKVPDALLKVGLTYQKLGRANSAKDVFGFLINNYPSSDAARIARERHASM